MTIIPIIIKPVLKAVAERLSVIMRKEYRNSERK